VPPVEDSVAAWAARNGCAAAPTVTQVSEHVEQRTFTGCRNGDEVVFYVISNGGHTWPGSKAAATVDKDPETKGVTTMEIDATKLAWAFFQRFQNP
jgi:polyhydroxybutyrate depolymerase